MGRHSLENTHRQYQVTQLWEVHHEIVRLALIGMHQVDIAKKLGINPVTVSYTLRSPIVVRQLEQMRAVRDLGAVDVAKEIAGLAPKAVEVLAAILEEDGDKRLQLKAAESILDRAGFAPVQRMRVDGNVSHSFSAAEIAEIKSRAKDIGLMVDAEYEQLPAIAQQASG